MSLREERDALLVVVADLINERHAQDAKWGEQNHSDGTGPDALWVIGQNRPAWMVADGARSWCQTQARRGEVTWLNILHEELAEAFASADETELRSELVQVMAVAAAWIEAIDRRTSDGAR